MTESRIFMPTRRQKRLLVQGRLIEPDAPGLSDRAIARELRVSQPFVSAMRRHVGITRRSRRSRTIEERMSLPEVGPSTADVDVLGIQEGDCCESERWSEAHDLSTAAV